MSTSFFKSYLKHHPSISSGEGLYYHHDLKKNSSFENDYISLRKKEGRFYDDAIVAKLPSLAAAHPLSEEWKVRKSSADRLIGFLKIRNPQTVLEVGCGNGWLTHYIHDALQADCCGVDVNEIELKQAAHIFGHKETLSFLYADIFSGIFEKPFVDIIIVASVIQYFPDPHSLFNTLMKMLVPGGQIHILDSPFYHDERIELARQRSEKYFFEAGQPQMQAHYFHHSWSVLDGFSYSLGYNPASRWNRLWRKIAGGSPFPWVIIENNFFPGTSKSA